MRYLVLLFLIIGCAAKTNYKEGNCIRVYSSISVIDFYVREVTPDKYVVSVIFGYIDNKLSHSVYKNVFDKTELNIDNSRKINCSEAE